MKNILYIEDSYDTFTMVKYSIGDHYKLTKALNCSEAIELCKSSAGKVDLVLFELGSGKVDGVDLTKKIRRSNENVPIIALSGYFGMKTKKECLEAGCNLFLEKPVSKDQLLEAILEQLES